MIPEVPQMPALLAALPSPPFQQLTLGPLNFRMYGLVIALGVLAAVAIARRRFSARGGDPEDITTVAIFAVPAGLVGARIYHVITDFGDRYSDGRWWPDAFFIWNGGLGIPGGVLLGAIVAIIACKRMKLDWRQVADAAAPAIPVAQAIGRLGNWFNQELYGRPTELFWGLEIDAPPAEYPPGTLFHPTFLYEALWNLMLAGLIVLGGRRVVLKAGRWFAVYVAGYGLGRLWVESLRIDFATEVLGFRVNTWISLFLIAGGLLWLFWKGSPIDKAATAELAAGGDPLARAAMPAEQAAQEAAALETAASEDAALRDELRADDEPAPDETAPDETDRDQAADTESGPGEPGAGTQDADAEK